MTRTAALFLVLPLTQTLAAQPGFRTLTGTVLDRHHEPLRGAVVQCQDEITNSIVSYITQANGQFTFKRLNPNDDYRTWATFRGHKTHNKEMSHFDSRPDKTITLTVDLD